MFPFASCRPSYTTVSQKVPGMVLLHCNTVTYEIAHQIALKVGSLSVFTFAFSILTLLEAPVEGFFRNLAKFGCSIRYHVLHCCETCPLEAHFQSREQSNATWSEMWRLWWLYEDRNVYILGELLQNKRRVGFEVFTAVIMKNGVFWDVMQCGSSKDRRIRGS
jgi:hypothetical protein